MEKSTISRTTFRIIHLNNVIIREWSHVLKFRCRVFAKGPIYFEEHVPVFRLLLGDETGYLHAKMMDITYFSRIQVSDILDLSVRGTMKNLVKEFDKMVYTIPGKWDLTIANNFNILVLRGSENFGLPKVTYSFAITRPFAVNHPINICGIVKEIPDEDLVILQLFKSEELNSETDSELRQHEEPLVYIRIRLIFGSQIMENLEEGYYVRFTGLGYIEKNTLDCSYLGSVEVFTSVELMMQKFWKRNSPLQAKKFKKNFYGF